MKEYTQADLERLGLPTMDDVEELVEELKVVLRGRAPLLVGAALADVVAMYFAGHNPEIREQAFTIWVETMRKMIATNEGELLERYGLTEAWERKRPQ